MRFARRSWYLAVLALLFGGFVLWSQSTPDAPSLQDAAQGGEVVGAAQPATPEAGSREDGSDVVSLAPTGERFSVRGWDVSASLQDRTGTDSELHLFDKQARQRALEASGRTSGEIAGSTIVIETGASATRRWSWAETAETGSTQDRSPADVLDKPAEVISLAADYHVVAWRDGDGNLVTAAVEGLTRRQLDRSVLDRIETVSSDDFTSWLADSVFMPDGDEQGSQG